MICPACKGKKYFEQGIFWSAETVECEICFGVGEIDEDNLIECPDCNQGRVVRIVPNGWTSEIMTLPCGKCRGCGYVQTRKDKECSDE